MLQLKTLQMVHPMTLPMHIYFQNVMRFHVRKKSMAFPGPVFIKLIDLQVLHAYLCYW